MMTSANTMQSVHTHDDDDNDDHDDECKYNAISIDDDECKHNAISTCR